MATETHLRRDAAANRERILDAARATLLRARARGEHGRRRARSRRRGRDPVPPVRDEGGAPGRHPRRRPRALPRVLSRGATAEDDAFAGLELLFERTVSCSSRTAPSSRSSHAPARGAAARRRARARAAADGGARGERRRHRERFGPTSRPRTSRSCCGSSAESSRPQAGARRSSGGVTSRSRWTACVHEAARPLPHPPPTSAELDRAMAETAERRGLHRERPPRRT